jgi:CRISPR-associated protein Cas1
VQLYIQDSSDKIGFSENQVTVWSEERGERGFPVETIEGISIFGMPSLSSKFLRECLNHNIQLCFYSTDGHYFGRMVNSSSTSTSKQKLQAKRSDDDDFRLSIAKKIICAKISNQEALLKAHDKDNQLSLKDFEGLEYGLTALKDAKSVEEVMGLEGNAARTYFTSLAKLVPGEWRFQGRSKRPPKDEFNAMISLGYSLLTRNIIGAIERHGLNPYFGFMHADAEGHPTLASDLIEEWRAIIVDDTVLEVINSGKLNKDQFNHLDSGAVYVGYEGSKVLVRAISDKVCRARSYLNYDHYKYGFQHALDLQIYRFTRAIESNDPDLYIPVSELPESEIEVKEVYEEEKEKSDQEK